MGEKNMKAQHILPKALLLVLCMILISLPGVAVAQNSIVLYGQQNFQGPSEAFTASDPDLKDNPIGAHSLWSARVPENCQIVLYELENYQGDSAAVRSDDPNLGDNRIEIDHIRSIQVSCSSGRGIQQAGVTLYEHPNYAGRSQLFAVDDSDLRDNLPTVGSLKLSSGCRATLYEVEDFQGDQETFSADDPNLGDNAIESDFIKSLKVSCPSTGASRSTTPAGSASLEKDPGGVVLYSEEKYKGAKELFINSDPNLNDNAIGNNAVSSVLLPGKCKAKLYEHPEYKGKYVLIKRNTASLKGTKLGNNAASSIEVFCD
jgi:hypothetical protein